MSPKITLLFELARGLAAWELAIRPPRHEGHYLAGCSIGSGLRSFE
jgi:hypothetical protein